MCSPRWSARVATRPPAAACAAGSSAPGSITTADIGKLDWPVEGTIVYRFGRDTLPSGGIIRWNGVGIAAAVGNAGQGGGGRERCGWWDSSAPTDSRSSSSTATATTRSTPISRPPVSSWAATVAKGDVIGTVGGENSDYGPHLHFEIRGENQVALDPTEWLRKR